MFHIENFTPLTALAGGALIGLAASLVLLGHGRVAGISGIYGGLIGPQTHDPSSRIGFIAGLFLAGVIARIVAPQAFEHTVAVGLGTTVIAGLLVGFGTRLGNGCTSGHGVCGLSRLSVRSLAATMTFMTAGFLAVYSARHLLGGAE